MAGRGTPLAGTGADDCGRGYFACGHRRVPRTASGTISGVIFVLLARSWFGLSIAMTALAVLRRDRSRLIVGVGALPALGVLLVTMLPAVPLIIGAFLMAVGGGMMAALGVLLLVGGACWATMWSQAGMLLMDGRVDFLRSGESSSFMTRGYRSEIMLLWLGTAIAFVAAGWLESRISVAAAAYLVGPPIAAVISLALRILADLVATCIYAALYFELDKAD